MRFNIRDNRKKLLGALLFVAVSIAIVACFPEFERLTITQLSTPPVAASMVSDHIELTAGTGVIVEVEPVSGNSEPYNDSDDVELESGNLNIMRVMRGERFREFAITGVTSGSTHMRVLINGSCEQEILVTVR